MLKKLAKEAEDKMSEAEKLEAKAKIKSNLVKAASLQKDASRSSLESANYFSFS